MSLGSYNASQRERTSEVGDDATCFAGIRSPVVIAFLVVDVSCTTAYTAFFAVRIPKKHLITVRALAIKAAAAAFVAVAATVANMLVRASFC